MDERDQTGQTRQPIEPRPPWSWREVGLVVALMVLTVGLRTWQIGQTAVASRDSIAFIHYAWLLDHQPWPKVLRTAPRHPGYPVAVWAASKVLRGFLTVPEPMLMQASAQWTSGLVSVLLVIPLYALGRAWFGRTAALGAVLLFQGLPTSSLILADGLSEGLFLLVGTTALWAATVGLRDRSPAAMGLAGLFGGLAYLVRPEGALIVAAAGVVLLAQQAFRARRQPWGRLLVSGAGLFAAGLIVALPLILTTGKLTPKTTFYVILDGPATAKDEPIFPTPYLPWPHQIRALNKLALSPASVPSPPDALVPAAPAPSAPMPPEPPPARAKPTGLAAGSAELGWELLEGVGYFVWLPVLIGVVVHRRRLMATGGAWVFLLASAGILAFLWRVAVTVGYLSERHLLLIVLGATLAAAAGLAALARGLAGWMNNRLDRRLIFAVLVVGTLLPFIGRSLQPLHPDRACYRTAGLWLAEHSDADDVIVDPHCWAAFYAGKAFRPDDGFTPTPASQKLFVVLDGSESSQSHLLTMPLARQLAARGEVVYRAGTPKGKGKGEVIVYQVPLPKAPR